MSWREIILFEIIPRPDLGRQHTTADGRVRDDRDAELAARVEEVDGRALDVEGQGKVVDLRGCDGGDGASAAEGGGGALGEAGVADLAFAAATGPWRRRSVRLGSCCAANRCCRGVGPLVVLTLRLYRFRESKVL